MRRAPSAAMRWLELAPMAIPSWEGMGWNTRRNWFNFDTYNHHSIKALLLNDSKRASGDLWHYKRQTNTHSLRWSAASKKTTKTTGDRMPQKRQQKCTFSQVIEGLNADGWVQASRTVDPGVAATSGAIGAICAIFKVVHVQSLAILCSVPKQK